MIGGNRCAPCRKARILASCEAKPTHRSFARDCNADCAMRPRMRSARCGRDFEADSLPDASFAASIPLEITSSISFAWNEGWSWNWTADSTLIRHRLTRRARLFWSKPGSRCCDSGITKCSQKWRACSSAFGGGCSNAPASFETEQHHPHPSPPLEGEGAKRASRATSPLASNESHAQKCVKSALFHFHQKR